MFSKQRRSFVSLPGGAVVDPGPGCVGWSPEVVFVVPLPDMRIKYMNILRFNNDVLKLDVISSVTFSACSRCVWRESPERRR